MKHLHALSTLYTNVCAMFMRAALWIMKRSLQVHCEELKEITAPIQNWCVCSWIGYYFFNSGFYISSTLGMYGTKMSGLVNQFTLTWNCVSFQTFYAPWDALCLKHSEVSPFNFDFNCFSDSDKRVTLWAKWVWSRGCQGLCSYTNVSEFWYKIESDQVPRWSPKFRFKANNMTQ